MFGQMPCLNCGTPHGNHGHQWCNGGIPQLANTTAHVAAMERDMASRVPENFTGFIVHVSFSNAGRSRLLHAVFLFRWLQRWVSARAGLGGVGGAVGT